MHPGHCSRWASLYSIFLSKKGVSCVLDTVSGGHPPPVYCSVRRGCPVSWTLFQVGITLQCPAYKEEGILRLGHCCRWTSLSGVLHTVQISPLDEGGWSLATGWLLFDPLEPTVSTSSLEIPKGHGCVSHASHLASENSSQRPPSASISQIHSTHLGSQEPQCPPSGSTSLLHIQTPTELSRPAPGTHGPGVSQGGHCAPVSVLTADAQPQTPSLWVKSTMPSCYSWDPQMIPNRVPSSARTLLQGRAEEDSCPFQ